jgi:hypothetical protein
VKLQIKQEQVRIDRLRAEQANADAALANEQSRWSDFNARLEALERALDAVTTRGR